MWSPNHDKRLSAGLPDENRHTSWALPPSSGLTATHSNGRKLLKSGSAREMTGLVIGCWIWFRGFFYGIRWVRASFTRIFHNQHGFCAQGQKGDKTGEGMFRYWGLWADVDRGGGVGFFFFATLQSCSRFYCLFLNRWDSAQTLKHLEYY